VVLTEKNFKKIVLENPLPVLVEIEADWSGTCHIISPILDHLAHIYKGRILIGKLNVETNKQLAREYGVTELPLLLFFKNGNLIDHIIGAVSKSELEAKLQYLLKIN
jgi:thioredoxin 1